MPSQSKFWEGSSFCLITGASRGIGRAVAVEFAKLMGKGSALLLMARDVQGLNETRSEVTKVAPEVKVIVESVDLSKYDSDKFIQSINACLKKLDKKASDFAHAIIIHNAASLLNKVVAKLDQPTDIENYFNMNVTSAICLNAEFLKVFKEETVKRHTIIQVSSLAAVRAFPNASLYCAAKAARNMIFKSLALENPKLNVLNYAPGVVSTKLMWDGMSSRGTPEVIEHIKRAKYLLSPTASVQKLIQILEEGKYQSGDHVDAYDDPETAYASIIPQVEDM